VTTELDMFADPAAVAELRRETTDRAALRSAGTGATAPGGHPCQLVDQGLVPPFPTIAGPGAAERFVADRVAEGSDYLKVFLEPGTSTGRAQPTPDDATVRALVAAGHAAGLLVVAHATDADAARRAVAAGVDGLVHVWVDGAAPDLVAAVAAADVFVVPTLTVIDGLWGTGAGARTLASEERVAPYLDDVSRGGLGMGGVGLGPDGPALATAAVGALHAAGVAILAGTDAANPGTAHGASVHQELRLLVAAGLTPVEALRSATAEPAARFRLADRGRVAPGLVADLVLVAGDPTRDVTATTAITAVWRRGVRLERESYASGLAPARSLVDLGGLDPVAATARWVAAERARESARPDALFTDPLADRLAGEPGRALAAWMRGDSQFESPTLPVRTRFFDDAVLAVVGRGAGTPDGGRAAGAPDADRVAAAPTTGGRATADPTTGHHPPTDPTPADQPPTENPPVNHSPANHLPADHPPTDPTPADQPPTDRPPADQVVVLAAGMDARAYRLDLPAELAWFELDRPALLAVKERELAEVVPRCRRYAIGCDLAEDWPAALLGAGFDPARPAVWLVEGLLAYLDGDLVELLLDRLTALAAPGSHLLCDPIGESLLASPWMRPYLAKLADAGMAWRFGTERPEELLVPRGWRPTVSLMADVATGLGRWPFPQMPRDTPGVPQSFLVHAQR
jgi:O-methyltransferase involved in polyketide biosynthesis